MLQGLKKIYIVYLFLCADLHSYKLCYLLDRRSEKEKIVPEVMKN